MNRGPKPWATARAIVLAVVVLIGLGLSSIDPFTVVFYTTYAVTGAILVVRRPRNSIGWILLVIGWGFVGTTTDTNFDATRLVGGPASDPTFLRAWFASWAGSVSFVGYLALAIVFPTGDLPSGRARIAAWVALTIAVACVALTAASPRFSFSPDGGPTSIIVENRLAIAPDSPLWEALAPNRVAGDTLFVFLLGLVIAAAMSLIIRFRRSRGIVRLQLRWLVTAVAFVVVALVTGLAAVGVLGDEIGFLAWLPATVAYPTVPLAILIAVTRHRLFEIDRLVSRTISYAGVTVTLFGVFAIVNLAAQAVLGSFVQGNAPAVALSTLVVAALFNPLRLRLQQLVDRRFNRGRLDQQRTIDGFAAGLRDEVDVDRVAERLRASVRAAVEPAAVTLWRRQS